MWLSAFESSLMGADEVAARFRVNTQYGLNWHEADLRRQLIG